MPLTINDLKKTLTLLENSFDDAYAIAPDAATRQTLRATLTAARDAFWKAVAAGLEDENDFVMALSDELKQQNKVLQRAAADLEDLAAFLDAAREAVKTAAAIATLAAPV